MKASSRHLQSVCEKIRQFQFKKGTLIHAFDLDIENLCEGFLFKLKKKKNNRYLHSIFHGSNSVYTAFTDGVGADPDVLLQLVQIRELG